MLTFMIVTSLVLTVMVNVITSCYVCYNIATDAESPKSVLFGVTGVVLVNAIFPYFLGCVTGLWYIG